MTKPLGGAPPQNTTRKSNRIEKGRRAYVKSLVHLRVSYGHKIEFDVETRDKLSSVLNRLKPPPSPRRANQMIGWAEQVVSDLVIARDKIEQTSETDKEEKALRNLLKCAKRMLEACSAVSEHKQLSYAMNVRLMHGLIKSHANNIDSEKVLRKAWKTISGDDFFAKVNGTLVKHLRAIARVSSLLIDELDASPRIKVYPDHWNAMVLANKWVGVFGEPPTFVHLDTEEEGRLYEPSPFQAFVAALPLDRPIKDEALRTAVEYVREFGGGVYTPGE
jgi:hypothetical protein